MATLDPPHFRMRRSLSGPLAIHALPPGISMVPFEDGMACAAHALLQDSYKPGGGSIAPFAVWWPKLTADSDYAPELCFSAVDENHQLVGFCQCWASAFVKDLAVHSSQRQRGIGAALLLAACAEFQRRGAAKLELKVDLDNPSGALRFYIDLGFVAVERLPPFG